MKWDMIVSNPPFSKKQQVVERCLSFGKPFALILSNLWLNSSAPVRLFKDKEMQMLLFDKRIQFTEKMRLISVQVIFVIRFCLNKLSLRI